LDDVDEALRAFTESDGKFGAAVGAPSQHVVFYAVAQAVLLIFCFRWRDLMIEEEEDEENEQQKRQQGSGEVLPESISAAGQARKDEWIPELNVLKRVVMSVLNPLKVCSPGVVMQFARVAHQTGFVYCYSILESNKRSSPSAKSSSSASSSHMVPSSNSMVGSSSTVSTPHLLLHPTFLRGELNNELNTFFPFDPYRLPRSGTFIQEVYREWSDVAIDGDEDDDEDEDDDSNHSDSDNEGDSSDDEGNEVSTGSSGYLAIPGRHKREEASDDGGLGASLVAMSISPGVKGATISESLGSTMAMSISYS
jgi:RNA polymerase I-specific transcription initiation factor RRN3